MKLLDTNDLKKLLTAPDNPEYTEPLHEIPDPPRFFDAESAEYWYHLCSLLQKKGRLTKWNTVLVEGFIGQIVRIGERSITPADKQILSTYSESMGVSPQEIQKTTLEFAG